MINKQYKEMLEAKSVIRELSEYATARAAEIGRENVYDFTLGNPSVPAPKEFKEAVISTYEEIDSIRLHGYSPTTGRPEIDGIVAESLRERFGIEYEGKHIFMTSAAASAIAHAVRVVTKPGDTLLGFAPFFPEYIHYVGATGVEFKTVSPDWETFLPDLNELERMIDTNVSAILINSPNNPSGVIYDESTLKAIADILYKKQEEFGHEIFIISDEPYREIVFGGQKVPYTAKYYDNTITCYSFSKSLSLPGERIGYLAVNPKAKDADIIVPMCGQISRGIGHNCPTATMQHAVVKVLNLTSDISVYEENANILYNELTKLGIKAIKPGGTFYILFKALEDDAVAFCKKALKYDLVLVPADTFGAPGYVRAAYCVETEKVKRSIDAFRKFVEGEYGNN